MQTLKSLFLMLALLVSVQAYAAPVDINTADAAMLSAELVGIGEKKAEAIIAYREANGPFKSAGELANVKGIGENTLMKNADNILTE